MELFIEKVLANLKLIRPCGRVRAGARMGRCAGGPVGGRAGWAGWDGTSSTQVRDVLDGRSERGTLLEVWAAAKESHSRSQAWTTECTEASSWSSIHRSSQAAHSFAALSGIDTEHVGSFFS
jgi:hypothetical protein